MHIEFMGRAVRLEGEQSLVYLFPDDIFEIVRWAKVHEFSLLEKARELQHIEEQKKRRNTDGLERS